MNWAAALRCELASRAQTFASERSIPHSLSCGKSPVVCFPRCSEGFHGNFYPASFAALHAHSEWRRRLDKVHSSAKQIFPRIEGERWKELDSCMSSDALLMNIFCHPGVARNRDVCRILAVEGDDGPHYGFRPRVPLLNERLDRTEVDMKIDDLLVEAKLTENDFQRCRKPSVHRYRDFLEVFADEQLRQDETYYYSYQLIRHVLAAHASRGALCVLLDSRRPDLLDQWYDVMKCVRPVELRTRCRVLTWQELSHHLPSSLREFLAIKYGI